jgi:hypothetical protein
VLASKDNKGWDSLTLCVDALGDAGPLLVALLHCLWLSLTLRACDNSSCCYDAYYKASVRLDGCSIEVLYLMIVDRFIVFSCSTFELRVHHRVVTPEPLVLPCCAARQPLAYMVVNLTRIKTVLLRCFDFIYL